MGATGRNPAKVFVNDAGDRNLNMSASDQGPGFETGWPQTRLDDDKVTTRWLHSDLKAVAYPFNHKLHEKLVELGELSNEN